MKSIFFSLLLILFGSNVYAEEVSCGGYSKFYKDNFGDGWPRVLGGPHKNKTIDKLSVRSDWNRDLDGYNRPSATTYSVLKDDDKLLVKKRNGDVDIEKTLFTFLANYKSSTFNSFPPISAAAVMPPLKNWVGDQTWYALREDKIYKMQKPNNYSNGGMDGQIPYVGSDSKLYTIGYDYATQFQESIKACVFLPIDSLKPFGPSKGAYFQVHMAIDPSLYLYPKNASHRRMSGKLIMFDYIPINIVEIDTIPGF